ncbi:alanyl-tRNA editing protein [Halobiforma nitratireducens]|uniref:Threonyl/alanyl tRNA synthetase SAD n=1 Tax=Halobiforma nitratireducens JCM 10879 TaxID=1227454 RepID=M0MBC8_9EURY|nr:alanyl-tRNA editing protein [Halobiforma nitratireducens]EMA43077.1 threonyl/alanyl tRNA synthetase SAD [Halobiforma nitratireducens JCM 10879]
MSGQLAAAEPYATRFETEVTAIDGTRVWLERSYFYAESGGQPADRGRIGDAEVVDVHLVDGEPVHVLAEEPSFRAGTRVLCSIDWSFRMYCMRAHTASHVLYGAGRRLLDDLGYGGFDIGEEKVRVDLETSTTIDDETVVELDELVNRAVWESRPVSWDDVPVAQARKRDDVAFNEATEDGAFEKGRVRLVTIGGKDDNGNGGNGGRSSGFGTNGTGPKVVTSSSAGDDQTMGDGSGLALSDGVWDVAACGGTHVRNTREIGPVTLLGRANPGEGLTRIEFAVGPSAIDRRTAEKRAALDAKRTLDATIDGVSEELSRVVDERDDLADRLAGREQALAAARLAGGDVSTFDRDGETWLTATVGDLPIDAVSEGVRERVNSSSEPDAPVAGAVEAETGVDIVVAVGGDDATFAVAGAADSATTSATAVLDELGSEFGGGGGGSDRVAQGGGFDAAPEELRRYIE